MAEVRISSADEPFVSHQEAGWLASRLVSRASFLGILLPEPTGDRSLRLDEQLVVFVLQGLADAGVAKDAVWRAENAHTGDEYAEVLRSALSQAEHSPMPKGEWPPLAATLGEPLLAQTLGVSATSIRRYVTGSRSTPQDVALRLHFIALLVADLAGAYNDYGIRRWFTRPRSRLDGRRPIDLLGAQFDPEGPDAERLRELVDSLVFAGAT